jgi:hypothetical protein
LEEDENKAKVEDLINGILVRHYLAILSVGNVQAKFLDRSFPRKWALTPALALRFQSVKHVQLFCLPAY